MYIEYINGRTIKHYSPSEIDQITLPDELLESLARALVPDFQAYIRAKREAESQHAKQDILSDGENKS